MSEEKWHSGLMQTKPGLAQCLVACCCGYIGVCAVQACNGKRRDGKACKPFFCAACLLCFGMALNRKAVRKEYRIPGSCLLDSLLYICGCCFLVSQEYREIDYQKSKRVSIPPPPMFIPGVVQQVDKEHPPENKAEPPTQHPSPADKSRDIRSPDPAPASTTDLDVIRVSIGHTNAPPPPPAPVADEWVPESEASFSDNGAVAPPVEIVDIATLPRDGNDPLIYSHELATPPFSFLIGIPRCTAAPNSDDYYPPPTYLDWSILSQAKPRMSRDIWNGLERDPDGGMVCTDQAALKNQEGVASYVIKQLGWALLKGLGAVSISLPIRIFEPRSTCERLFDRFSFAPVYLKRAADSVDQMERFRLVLAFAVSSLYLGVKQEKPFNPLLGETMQGSFPDGAQVYCEHTRHNPPTDHFYIVGPGYTVFGYYELDGSFTGNSLVGSFRGPTHIIFHKDGQRITYTQPKFRLGGVLMGKRTLNWEGDMEFEDPTNNWIAVVKIQTTEKMFNPKKIRLRLDQFLGKIYTPLGNRRDKIEKEIASLEGSWMEELKVNGETVWRMDEELPLRHEVARQPLPSDWRYREDLIWLMRGNQKVAQAWKSRLEQRQRDDRDKRAAGAKRRKR